MSEAARFAVSWSKATAWPLRRLALYEKVDEVAESEGRENASPRNVPACIQLESPITLI
ncbi:hypothetical protein ACNKHK_01445 [Shigella flexneri]